MWKNNIEERYYWCGAGISGICCWSITDCGCKRIRNQADTRAGVFLWCIIFTYWRCHKYPHCVCKNFCSLGAIFYTPPPYFWLVLFKSTPSQTHPKIVKYWHIHSTIAKPSNKWTVELTFTLLPPSDQPPTQTHYFHLTMGAENLYAN